MTSDPAPDSRDSLMELWNRYKRRGDREAHRLLVEAYLPFARALAMRTAKTLPDEVDSDDLISAGVVGLLEAVDAFTTDYGVSFQTYSWPRIRGAIHDYIRSMTWIPALARTRAVMLNDARRRVAERQLRPPATHEVAEELGVGRAELARLERDAASRGLLRLTGEWCATSIVSYGGDVPVVTILDSTEETDTRIDLKETMRHDLSLFERQILILYYYEQMTMKETSEILGLSESRISQIHSSVLERLKRGLEQRGWGMGTPRITVTEDPEYRRQNRDAVSEAVSRESSELMTEIPGSPAVDIYLRPGGASATDIADLFAAVDRVYMSLGGPGLKISDKETLATIRPADSL